MLERQRLDVHTGDLIASTSHSEQSQRVCLTLWPMSAASQVIVKKIVVHFMLDKRRSRFHKLLDIIRNKIQEYKKFVFVQKCHSNTCKITHFALLLFAIFYFE